VGACKIATICEAHHLWCMIPTPCFWLLGTRISSGSW
jgi:hypothetical protein